ncbi:hypothetical protein Y032_0843g2639 [Ancylostoma ceylanicum]|uniref:Uncharacterized protein n=1 Tax=Ancylostoma ceylanicum TaxID=53326 RepID=A0A016WC89_9BILA|nr:hypothetical protein Y032_0843g2639 [Ancylostoma ceylanicum]
MERENARKMSSGSETNCGSLKKRWPCEKSVAEELRKALRRWWYVDNGWQVDGGGKLTAVFRPSELYAAWRTALLAGGWLVESVGGWLAASQQLVGDWLATVG